MANAVLIVRCRVVTGQGFAYDRAAWELMEELNLCKP